MLFLRLLSSHFYLYSSVRCCSSRRVLKEGEVADHDDEAVELEKVEKCFGGQLEEDPGYTNEQVIINDEDIN